MNNSTKRVMIDGAVGGLFGAAAIMAWTALVAAAEGNLAAFHGVFLSSYLPLHFAAFAAIGAEAASLEAGIKELPEAFKEGNRTFARLPAALAALRKLVNVSKPNTKKLALFFERLDPLLKLATPVLRQLSTAISKPGPNNDLTEFALALPGLAKSLKSASPSGVKALHESVPVTAFFGPYSPDLIGLFHDFGQEAGYYDGNGHYVRVSPDFADFRYAEEKLIPVTPQEGLEGLKTGQLTRCPGAATQPAADGSSPYTDEGKLGCNPQELP
jgi:phospholipid/cholesterol/gamma-HCH transport system substrate-binding protein